MDMMNIESEILECGWELKWKIFKCFPEQNKLPLKQK